MSTSGMLILVMAVVTTAVYGQTISGEKAASKWPEWKDKAGITPEKKPWAVGGQLVVKRESGSVSSLMASEVPKPKDLFQIELDQALAFRRQWVELQAQIPKRIPRGLDASGYANLVRLIERTYAAKKKEFDAWKQYHEAHRSHWSKRWKEEDISNDTIKSEIERIQLLLEQEETALKDLEQRLKDLDQTSGNAADAASEIRLNLLAIRDQHVERMQQLRRTLAELAATLDNKGKMRIIAESNIALVENNLKTNVLEGVYWKAVYESVRSVVRLFQDEVTPRPVSQPKGEQL